MKSKETRDGYSFCVTNDWIIDKDGRVPEHELILWSRQFTSKDQCFVDVGAHMGTYSIMLAASSEAVYSFEAQKRTYHQLVASVHMNGLDNVICRHVAVGSPEEHGTEIDLHIVSEDGGGSNIDRCNSAERVLVTERVMCESLDEMKLPNNVGLIKIDVEGHELEVLRGATRMIQRCRPVILFECWTEGWYASKKMQVLGFLESIGYRTVPIAGMPHMFLATHLKS